MFSFPDARQYCVLFARVFFLKFFCFLVCKMSLSRYERRGEVSIKDESDWDTQTRWMKMDMVISICVNEGYTLHHVAGCPSHNKCCCLSGPIALL